MLDILKVIELANKMNQVQLTKADVIYIIKHYSRLRTCYGIGGYNMDIQSLK